jgi:hypothetical protein
MKKHELAEKISHLVVKTLDDGPIEKSRTFLPMSTDVTIEPGQSAQITARPQLPFRGDRLAVWSVVAADFVIEDLHAGRRALSAQAGSVPADAFATRLDLLPMLDQQLDKDGFVQIKVSHKAEECFGQPLAFPLVRPGQDVIMVVTNVSTTPRRFVAAILGDVEYEAA